MVNKGESALKKFKMLEVTFTTYMEFVAGIALYTISYLGMLLFQPLEGLECSLGK